MKFSEMKYERFNLDEYKALYTRLAEEVKNAKNPEEIIKRINEHEKAYSIITTAGTLAHTRHTIDTTDTFYDEENKFIDENMPLLQEAFLSFTKALFDSPFRPELEKKYGSLIFVNLEMELKSFSPEIVPMLQEENMLVTEYQKLTASAQIDYDGKKLTVSQMGPYTIDKDRNVRKSAYEALASFYKSVGEQLDELFDKLVKIRTKIAKTLGYESFTELGYLRMIRNSYTPEDVAAFRKQVAEDIVPIVSKLKAKQSERIGIAHMKFYDDGFTYKEGNPKPMGTPDDIFAAGKKMYNEMSEKTGEFINFMFENELLDCLSKKGKANGGYCTYIPEYKSPFIFSNFNGTAGDVDVLTHEAGHAFAAYMAKDFELAEQRNPTMESCEVHSMSMEFFAWKWLDLFYGEDADRAKFAHLESCLTFIPYGTMVDHFQHIMYDKPDLTPAQRHEEWKNLEKIYRPHMDFSDVEFYNEGRLWQRQLHIYHYPFYYIDYCLAQTVALEYWAMSQENYEEAFEKYMDFVAQGGKLSFVELCEKGGVIAPFEQGSLKSIVKAAEEWLG
ncbi:MAG: M3 family oligoendopeptidase [Clostridiales bacterium GWF2_36_10]|nr:MAG: M3 family oligoendopeptidase [Clostridiales bacterium GWF2_36_10]HAN20805.1 M3 family oligoendopeptidase [Clostridiales bacterium]